MIKVSVIVSIYNSRNWLKDSMESLLCQTMEDCEFICVDDGSSDGSYEIVERYREKDSRFMLIRQENKGLAEARNVGLRYAGGKYIAFLDADDWLQEPFALEELYEIAEKSDTDFVTFDADCFYETEELREASNRDEYYIRKKEYGCYSSGRELFCEFMEQDDFCDGAWVLFLKREWIFKNRLWFVPGLNPEDCIWSFFCYMRAGRVRHIQKRYYKYRIRANSLTTEEVSFAAIYGRIYTVKEILKYLLENQMTVREERAACKLIEIILWHMKDKIRYLKADEIYKLQELSPVEFLLAGYMNYPKPGHMRFHISIYMEGVKNTFKNAPGIILYGAGMVGRLVYRYIEREGLLERFQSFAVSDCQEEWKETEGKPVRCIRDNTLERTNLMVIAVTEKYREEMVRMARKTGFSRIFLIDEYFLRILEEYYA